MRGMFLLSNKTAQAGHEDPVSRVETHDENQVDSRRRDRRLLPRAVWRGGCAGLSLAPHSHRVQSDDEIIALWGDSFELHAAGL